MFCFGLVWISVLGFCCLSVIEVVGWCSVILNVYLLLSGYNATRERKLRSFVLKQLIGWPFPRRARGRIRTATEGKTCQLMTLHRDSNDTQLTALPASWHAFSYYRVSVWFVMMIATGTILSMDGALRNPTTFFIVSEFANKDPWIPRPKEPPDKYLCWVVRYLLMFIFVDSMVLLGIEEVLWKLSDPICGAFVIQRVLTKWIWRCYTIGTYFEVQYTRKWDDLQNDLDGIASGGFDAVNELQWDRPYNRVNLLEFAALFGHTPEARYTTEEDFTEKGPADEFMLPTSIMNPDLWCQSIGTPLTMGAAACMGATAIAEEDQVRSDVMSRRHLPLNNAMDTFAFQGKGTVPLVYDTGASRTVSGTREDFVELDESGGDYGPLDGIAKNFPVHIKGTGMVEYLILSDSGQTLHLRMKAYCVPDLPKGLRLVAPQGLRTKDGKRGSFEAFSNDDDPDSISQLKIYDDKKGWQRSTPIEVCSIQYHPRNNLPVQSASLPNGTMAYVNHLKDSIDVTVAANSNLSDAQKELLRWHYKLGHVGFDILKWMIRQSLAPVKNPNCGRDKLENPLCEACQFAGQCKRPTGATVTKQVAEKEMEIKKGDLLPGTRVSMDHYQSALPGRLYTSRGGTRATDMYHGGTVYVDHASGYVQVKHQVSLGANDSVKAKLQFERDSMLNGVYVQNCHTDNGTFTSKEFLEHLYSGKQGIRFSGVGAAHSNGVAERAIGVITTKARKLMIHAALRSPEGHITGDLWPMAMDHAVWLYNRIPKRQSGLSPYELWNRSTLSPTRELFGDCHVWGSPCFVLSPKLQKSGVKIPKWQPRSRKGIYLGFSPFHSSTVGLVLNLQTKSISPQWHIVVDDGFTTVFRNDDTAVPTWEKLLTTRGARLRHQVDDEVDYDLSDEWLTEEERISRDQDRRRRQIADVQFNNDKHRAVQDQYERENINDKRMQERDQRRQSVREEEIPNDTPPNAPLPPVTPSREPTPRPTPTPQRDQPASLQEQGRPRPPPPEPIDRPRRSRAPVKHFTTNEWVADSKWRDETVAMFAATLAGKFRDDDWSEINGLLEEMDNHLWQENHVLYSSAGHGWYSPTTFATKKTSDPDTPTWTEAMGGDEAEFYWEAMVEEIVNLEKRDVWTVVSREEARDAKQSIIPSTWAFKRKRRPSGEIKKYKSRFCIRGDVQKMINERGSTDTDTSEEADDTYEEKEDTFAPVISWGTVRLLLIMSIILKLETHQIDFSNAFTQAVLDAPVYLDLPEGFTSKGKSFPEGACLKLRRNLYGSCFGPALWYKKLRRGLLDRGFKVSERDPCLFLSPDVMVALYVDDVIFISRSRLHIDKVIKTFVDDGDVYEWEMTIEGDLKDFLGINLERVDEDGKGNSSWRLTQRGLINNVLEATGMTNCSSKPTPAAGPLGKDEHGPEREEYWHYGSVIGMLMYLANNSRPDLAFAVHQASRFTHCPKKSHENAVKRICRYLKGTMDDGLILKPNANISVDCYVDADFCGLWGTENPHEVTSAKSRTGFVITFAGCPLLWVSKLQTEVALSTTEAEVIALSQSMRELIPIKDLANELVGSLRMKEKPKYTTLSTVFEDNNGALTLATVPKLTPRSKHIAVKYWFFRTHVGRTTRIVKVDTKKQKADIFTKALPEKDFVSIRKLLCGW